MTTRRSGRVETVRASAYTVPADGPEADGTFAWSATTIVVVEVEGGQTGLGYIYSDGCITALIAGPLAACIQG